MLDRLWGTIAAGASSSIASKAGKDAGRAIRAIAADAPQT